MSGVMGFVFDPDLQSFVFRDGDRVVSTTDGTLMNFVPDVASYSGVNLTFPDFEKDECYLWTWAVWEIPLSSPTRYERGESCGCLITAVPQEYSLKTSLAAVADGADYFIGHIKISRTTDPQNTWMTRTLAVLAIEDEWIPVPGAISLQVEGDIGMVRFIHLYIDNEPLLEDGVTANPFAGQLVIEVEQSVSTAIGGYGSFGDAGTIPLGKASGGSFSEATTKGIPIFTRESKSYGFSNPGGLGQPTTYKKTGSSPCARDDTTIYTSVYSVDVQGRIGRRS